MEPVEATFCSRCPACDELIEEGDRIVKNMDDEWVHEHCEDE